jgi:hypothetical protein
MKATHTIIIAIVAMIGMTGLAMAGSTMNYDVDFSTSGDGMVDIQTTSPAGVDRQIASWVNCNAEGSQSGTYNGGPRMAVTRETTITGIQNGNPASGSIWTQSNMVSPGSVPGGFVRTVASYYDDNAGGSHIMLDQNAVLRDNDMILGDAGYERVDVDTTISGYAYGDPLTRVSGSVVARTDGSLTAETGISGYVYDGALTMLVGSWITDDTSDVERSRTEYTVDVQSPNYTADGTIIGYGRVNGVLIDSMSTAFTNADITVNGYFYTITL